MTQATSLYITGKIVTDSRSTFGYEMQVSNIEIIQAAIDYPITPKEHGIEFLMDHRHLWLRSRRQYAIMKIRDQLIRATYDYYYKNCYFKIDPPILTASSAEETTELFNTKYFDEDAYLSLSNI